MNSHGGRAKCLQRLIRLNLPVPQTVALPFDTVRKLARGEVADTAKILSKFGEGPLVSVRPSSEDPDWGGPGAILNIGMNDARHAEFANLLGHEAADQLYARFIQTYSIQVAHLDPDVFDVSDSASSDMLAEMLDAYEDETDEVFPHAYQFSDGSSRSWDRQYGLRAFLEMSLSVNPRGWARRGR